MEAQAAMCGCLTVAECAVCFTPLCQGDSTKNVEVCSNCMRQEVERGETLHPVTRTPIQMCKCGKPWIGECRFFTLPHASVIDMEKVLAECSTPAERRAACNDSRFHKPVSHLHGLL